MRVLLCCNAGMSSSILVNKMKEAAARRGIDLTISAVARMSISGEAGKWDVCLVGPQIAYAVESIKKEIKVPTACLEPRVYALADGDAALDFAIRLQNG